MKNIMPKISALKHEIGYYFIERALDKAKTSDVDGIDELDIPCSVCGIEEEPLYWLSKDGYPICIDCAEYEYAGFFTRWLIRKQYKRKTEFWNKIKERNK